MSGEKPQRQRRPVHPQLTFEHSPAPASEAGDFLVSASNEQAFGMVNLWPHWPEQLLLLVGPRGAGKSHLGAIWAAKAQANQCSATSLAAADAEALAARPLLLENADQIGGAEAELFHLINLVRERGTALVLTARSHPALWGLRTADLLSRLRLAPVAEIGAPDEALVQAVLVKLLVERQLATDAGVVSYAAARLERSLDAARTFVAALDREALARQSRITRAVAADVLSVLNFGEGGGGTEGGTQGPTYRILRPFSSVTIPPAGLAGLAERPARAGAGSPDPDGLASRVANALRTRFESPFTSAGALKSCGLWRLEIAPTKMRIPAGVTTASPLRKLSSSMMPTGRAGLTA